MEEYIKESSDVVVAAISEKQRRLAIIGDIHRILTENDQYADLMYAALKGLLKSKK